MAVLITFLGLSKYKTLTYTRRVRSGAENRITTSCVAYALSRFFGCDKVVVLATEEAWRVNGSSLTDALAALAIGPDGENGLEKHIIPVGETEGELREQFRTLLAAMSNAGDDVVVDITHGFRAQPFFATTVLSLLSARDKLPERMRIVYGAEISSGDKSGEEEAPKTGRIWDLTSFLLQQELAHGVAAFLKTGHAVPLIRALKHETEALRRRKQGGERADYDRSNPLVRAIGEFANDLATLRLPDLILGRNGRPGSAERLLRALEKYRERSDRDHPALKPVLEDLEKMASGLRADTLYGEIGRQVLCRLARLYLCFNRPLEAAAVIREGYTGLFADDPAATDAGRPVFNADRRRQADRCAGQALRSGIVDIRNDMMHAGMRPSPQPAAALKKNVEKELEKFTNFPCPGEERPQKECPREGHDRSAGRRIYFVTRHRGAVEWARRRGIEAEIREHLELSEIRPGDMVLGTLPVHLAAGVVERGGRYLHLSIDIPRERRGSELTAGDMEAFGATLEEYTLKRVENRDCKIGGNK